MLSQSEFLLDSVSTEDTRESSVGSGKIAVPSLNTPPAVLVASLFEYDLIVGLVSVRRFRRHVLQTRKEI
jgi:hypothetical protein